MRLTFLSLLLFGPMALAQPGPARVTASQSLILGRMEQLHSTILHDTRTLNIYLPPEYSEADTARFPVVYLLDGALDEDFIHIVGLYQFSSFPWVNRVKPSIIVGLANSNRKQDFVFPAPRTTDQKLIPQAGGSEAFIAFIEKELQPYIKKQYRTNGSKTLIGESLGGLLAAEILLDKPALFQRYIIVSPSLWWGNGALLRRSAVGLDSSFSAPTEVYVGVGNEGLTPGEPPHVQEVDARLFAEKLQATKAKHLRVIFDYLPEETHATLGHQAVLNALRLLAKPACADGQ
ncbi:MAG: alpha/beta hydrolase [Bacteroidetes bacterium]|nr:alpha/beta hydrolase [Bacteroidota bacterium]